MLAFAADVVVGDPPNRWHPVAWMGHAVAAGRRRLARGGPVQLTVLGATLVALVAAMAALAGSAIAALAAPLGAAGLVLEALALKSTFALRGLAGAAAAVAADLERGDLPAARARVGRDLVSRSTASLDETRVASAAIESVAENATDSLVAPLLFYAVFGLPGAFFYRAVNTADAMIGYRQGDLEHFGKAAARLDDLLNLAPARLSALALVAGAGLAGADARGALDVMRRDRGRTASPNAGWTMAAMAGALGVRLEKSGYYALGKGRPPSTDDVYRSLAVLWSTAACAAAAITLGYHVIRALNR